MQDCNEKRRFSIDLEKQVIIRGNLNQIKFDIDPFRKHCLLNGLDDIGLTMQKVDKIKAFELLRSSKTPWLDNASQKYI